jgi:hypothetical protein
VPATFEATGVVFTPGQELACPFPLLRANIEGQVCDWAIALAERTRAAERRSTDFFIWCWYVLIIEGFLKQ